MKRLQFSGYEQQFRYEVCKTALKKHKHVTINDPDKGEPRNTTTNKNRWFQKKNDVDAVMFVQATEDGHLKKDYKDAPIETE